MNSIPQSAALAKKSPRIYTRCPACHNDTLTIHEGHLLCTWHVCPDPTLIHDDNRIASRVGPLVDALKTVEWIKRSPTDRYLSCPCCGHEKDKGHSDNCALRAALATEPSGAKGEENEFPTDEEIATSNAVMKTLRANRQVIFRGNVPPEPRADNGTPEVDVFAQQYSFKFQIFAGEVFNFARALALQRNAAIAERDDWKRATGCDTPQQALRCVIDMDKQVSALRAELSTLKAQGK